jgi:uncharacterized membrane protein
MNKQKIHEEGEEIKQAVKQATNEFKKEVIDEQDDGVIAAVGYIWILFLIPMFLKKDSEFCQHHAKQGLVLFVFSLIVTVLGSIPIIGWLIIMPIGWIIVIVLMLLGIVNALRGSTWEMPYLGKYAKKLNF